MSRFVANVEYTEGSIYVVWVEYLLGPRFAFVDSNAIELRFKGAPQNVKDIGYCLFCC